MRKTRERLAVTVFEADSHPGNCIIAFQHMVHLLLVGKLNWHPVINLRKENAAVENNLIVLNP